MSPLTPHLRRLRRLRAELGYAQRRSLELRTGVSLTGAPRSGIARTVSQLEALFALPSADVGCEATER